MSSIAADGPAPDCTATAPDGSTPDATATAPDGPEASSKDRRRRQRWQRRGRALRGTGGLRIVAAAAGGLAVFGGFAPSTLWWLPIAGFALLALAVHGTGWRAAAGLGFVFGCLLFLPLLEWAGIYVGATPWVALALAEAVLVAPATALIGPASKQRLLWYRLLWPVLAAGTWVAGETLRALFPFGGFPWGAVAFTQPDGPLLPLVAVVGESGLTFALVLAGFGLGELLRVGWQTWRRVRGGGPGSAPVSADRYRDGRRAARWPSLAVWVMIVAILLPFAGAFAACPAVQTGAGAPTAPIAVIQGNVPEPGLEFNARRRAVLDMHAAETATLSRAIAAGTVPKPAWVLWPENSSDIDPYTNADAAAVIDKAAKEIGVPILVGAVVSAGRPGYLYNMGIVWDPATGPGQTYTKRHPIPFGEYMPWRSFFRIFSSKVDLVQADFLPGKKPGNLQINGIPVGDVICFEIVEDPLVRDVVRGGARLIVVQTNNATFGYTNESYQQQAMSRVRAVEYGREVLIASTSGVSAVIRPNGTIESSIGLFTAGFMVPEVPLISATTPGTVLGAPIRWALTVVCPLVLVGAFALSRRTTRKSGPRRAEGRTP